MVLCVVCALSVIMSSTLTWLATSSAVNSFSGSKGDYSVTLEKKEKDLEGNPTTTKVANAEFYLYRITNANPEEKEQIGGRYVTNSEGIIEVSGLVAGAYYFLETSVPYGYDYDKEADGVTDKKRYDFDVSTESVDATGNIKVEAFNIKSNSELEVNKTVENHDGSEISAEQKALDFTFAITFSDGKTYPYVVRNGEGESAEQTLVEGKFTLKHDETAIFKGVPINVVYNVTEIKGAEDTHIVYSNNHTGNIKREGNKATFVNVFGGHKSGSLIISKTVDDATEATDLDVMFTFTVQLGEDPEVIYPYKLYNETGNIDSGEIKSGNTIRLKHGQWVVFSDLDLDLDYQVNETEVEGFIQQLTEQKGEILESGVRADFVNTKIPPEEKFGNLIITKTVEIAEGALLEDEEGNLIFEDAEGNPIENPMEKVFHFRIRVGTNTYTCNLKHGEEHRIDNILVGTDYEVIEDDYYEQGYITSSVNTNATIVLGDNRADVKNVFDNPSDEEEYGKLRLEKHVVGGDNEKEFTFHVKIGDGPSKEIKLTNGGVYESEEFLVGTHYQIYEENYYGDGYITTSIGAMGTIIKPYALAAYTNTYEESPPEYGQLEISKVVSGAGDKTKDFLFTVKFLNGQTYSYEFTDKGGNTSTHATNDGKFVLKDGEKATFKNIPVGVVYEVVEETLSDYTQGLIIQKGVIVKDKVIKAPYENYKEPVPNEEGVLVIKKVTTGEGADLNKSFEFVVTIGDQTHEFSLKHGEEKTLLVPVNEEYEVSEEDYSADGYRLVNIENGTGTTTNALIEATAENNYFIPPLIDLEGTKTWDVPAGITLPDEITIYLKNGELVVKEAKATAQTNWEYIFEDVPKYDEDGEEIIYTVEEEAVAGFIASVEDLNVTNTYIEPVALSVPEVEKRIRVMGEGEASLATFTFTLTAQDDAPLPEGSNGNKKDIQLNGMGSISFGEIKFTLPGTYTYTIEEVIGSASGYTYDTTKYTYTVVVKEEGGELSANGKLTLEEDEFAKAIFINLFTPDEVDTTSVTVRKAWAGIPSDKTRPTSIKVQLYKNGKAQGEAITLNKENEWAHTWNELDKDANWSVDELDIPEGFTRVITPNGETGFTITNTYGVVTPTPMPTGSITPIPTGEPTPTGEVTPTPTPTKTPIRGSGSSGGGATYTSGKVATPKTDDPMAISLWFAVLILSVMGLRVVFVLSEKENKKRLNKK